MRPHSAPGNPEFGAVVLTLDTEQIWGYLDCVDESEFERLFPRASATAARLLALLCEARISATWTVVGGLSLDGSRGTSDPRMAGLPPAWTNRVRAGNEATAPLWYARSFVKKVRDAEPCQEIGLHGGLTHLCWDRPVRDQDTLRRELVSGIQALKEIGVAPTSFTFPRNLEGHHHLLAQHGIRCYRGRGPALGERLPRSLPGAAVRLLSETCRVAPPVVRAEEQLPGLWNLPSSLLLYRMSELRARLAPLSTRLTRVRLGIEAAARRRGVFHLWLHPENLAESPTALAVFEDIVEEIARARDAGNVEVLTMTQVADRMEGASHRVAVRQEPASVGAAAMYGSGVALASDLPTNR